MCLLREVAHCCSHRLKPAGYFSCRAQPHLAVRALSNTNALNAYKVEWNVHALPKLDIDLSRRSPLRALMEDDTRELIIRLCNRIGIIMEDTSVIALGIRRADEGQLVIQLAQLGEAATRIKQLIDACLALREK